MILSCSINYLKGHKVSNFATMPEAIDITPLVGASEERGVMVRLHMIKAGTKDEIAELMRPCVESAYSKSFSAKFLGAAYFALTITKDEAVIATLAAIWLPCPANTFESRFESVHKDHQRKGYGTMIFRALEVAGLFLAKHDPFIAVNVGGCPTLAIHAYVDVKKTSHPLFWHTNMMLNLGYKQIEVTRKERLMEKIIDL